MAYKNSAANKGRASDARAAIKALIRRRYEPENAMRDLLANLMHLDAQTGQYNPSGAPNDFEGELRAARDHFREEAAGW